MHGDVHKPYQTEGDLEVKAGSGKDVDWWVVVASGGFILLFIIAAIISIDTITSWVNSVNSFSIKWFGAFWQVLLLATFLIALAVAISPWGKVRLGKFHKPNLGTFSWIAMIMCTLLAGGGVFWSAAEPMYHFLSTPPFYGDMGIQSATPQAVTPALSYSYLHWGFLAWAILATLSAIVLMYSVYHRGQPLKPRSLLYPVFGEKAVKGPLGAFVDVFSIIAVAAGTIGPIGFLGLQLSYMLHDLFPSIPDAFITQIFIVLILAAVYTISAVTGLTRGIKWLSRVNVWLAIFLMGLIIIIGPGRFVINSFMTGIGRYIVDFIPISLYRGDEGWLGSWTVFYWAWFMGYGPMMAMFVARISRGRTIRQIVLAVGVIAPLVTNFWFTILGGTGIFYELQSPGVISKVLNESGLPAALLAIIRQLPAEWIFIPCFMVLVVLFLATTGDSMSYTIAMTVTGDENPYTPVRVFWGIAMAVAAAVLIRIGGVGALQAFIIITAVPVGLIMLPMLWTAPQVAGKLYRESEQGSVPSEPAPATMGSFGPEEAGL